MTQQEMEKRIAELEAEKAELKRQKQPVKAEIEGTTLTLTAEISTEPIPGKDTGSGNHRYFSRYFSYFPVYDSTGKKTEKRVKIDVIDKAGKNE